MKKLIKSTLLLIASISLIGCSSTPKSIEQYAKVGKVTQVIYKSNKDEPSLLAVIAGAAVGGVIGHQFGDGSGKDWATAGGALVGGAVTNKALTERYKSITYKVFFPIDKTTATIVTKNSANNVFRNDLVIVYKNGKNFSFDAYGKYTKKRYEQLSYLFKNGKIK